MAGGIAVQVSTTEHVTGEPNYTFEIATPDGVRVRLTVVELEDADDDDTECEGHESLAAEHMGESVYCDGTCLPRRRELVELEDEDEFEAAISGVEWRKELIARAATRSP